MPIQEYNINTKQALAGNLYGLTYTNTDRLSFICDEPVGYGLAIKRGDGVGRSCKPGLGEPSDTSARVMAITIREISRESQTYPSNGLDTVYRKGQVAGGLVKGRIYVIAVDGCVQGEKPFVQRDTGQFYGQAAPDRVEATNCVWEQTKTAGSVAIINILETME